MVSVSSVSYTKHRRAAADVHRNSVAAPQCGQSCEQTGGRAGGQSGQDVPAQVSELLVDALESHGYVYVVQGCGVVWEAKSSRESVWVVV